jgi:hypothetical protein
MSVEVTVSGHRRCDVCGDLARYDARTVQGQWANLCQAHFVALTLGRLGTGYGQRLVYADGSDS